MFLLVLFAFRDRGISFEQPAVIPSLPVFYYTSLHFLTRFITKTSFECYNLTLNTPTNPLHAPESTMLRVRDTAWYHRNSYFTQQKINYIPAKIIQSYLVWWAVCIVYEDVMCRFTIHMYLASTTIHNS